MSILEFYNKVHSKQDGKFADTPGPGHAKGAPKATKTQAAALKKVLSKPKTKAGSVVVPSKTAAIKGKTAPPAKKAAPAKKTGSAAGSASKAAPVKKAALAKAPVKKAAAAPAKKATPKEKAEALVKKVSAGIAAKKKAEDDGELIPKPDKTEAGRDAQAAVMTKKLRKLLGDNGIEVYAGSSGKDFSVNWEKSNGQYANYDLHPGREIALAHVAAFMRGHPPDGKDYTIKGGEATGPGPKAKGPETPDMQIERLGKALGHADLMDGERGGLNESPPPSGVSSVAKLNDNQVTAMLVYRGSGYDAINSVLRNPGLIKGKGPQVHGGDRDEIVGHLDSAFKAAPPTTRDITVYRVIRGAEVKLGPKFKDNGFVSTSYQQEIAETFRSMMGEGDERIIAIKIPKGSRVLKLSDAESSGGEAELLLPRGSTFVQNKDGSYTYTL